MMLWDFSYKLANLVKILLLSGIILGFKAQKDSDNKTSSNFTMEQEK
jgi:hypothetical protein